MSKCDLKIELDGPDHVYMEDIMK